MFNFLCVYVIDFTANAGKFYGGLINYCGKAWDVHLDCVMRVSMCSCDQYWLLSDMCY